MGIWFWVEDQDTGQRLNINSDDCDFITVTSGRYRTFVVGRKVYQEVRGIEELEADLMQDGFLLTDRSHLVNINKVKDWDPEKGKLYFEYPSNEKSVFASFARIHIHWISNIMRTILCIEPELERDKVGIMKKIWRSKRL
ncbi:LytTR family DNA-binding domain-containing protein [Paenibacillus sp. KR2-11]|uniref:LytTR family DNA-binding domain-containing protein n=1 Tax=Paenibacillus sp. KR2-11 TaxID=3385500 RepID=UPI0038FC7812